MRGISRAYLFWKRSFGRSAYGKDCGREWAKRHLPGRHTGKGLEGTERVYLSDSDLDFDVSCKMKHLTELEKRILDLAKAYRRGAKIVVIEDEFDGMSRKDIEIFARSMH